MTRESLADGKDASARVSCKQEALVTVSVWERNRVLLVAALLKFSGLLPVRDDGLQ